MMTPEQRATSKIPEFIVKEVIFPCHKDALEVSIYNGQNNLVTNFNVDNVENCEMRHFGPVVETTSIKNKVSIQKKTEKIGIGKSLFSKFGSITANLVKDVFWF